MRSKRIVLFLIVAAILLVAGCAFPGLTPEAAQTAGGIVTAGGNALVPGLGSILGPLVTMGLTSLGGAAVGSGATHVYHTRRNRRRAKESAKTDLPQT